MAIEGIVLVRGCWFGFCAGSEATVCVVRKMGELMFCGGPVQAGGWRKRLRKAFVEEVCVEPACRHSIAQMFYFGLKC